MTVRRAWPAIARRGGSRRARAAGTLGVLALGAALAVPSRVDAQRPTRRGQRTTTIEIRGQVPTPQVVTVRPREVPQYSRQVLTSGYYDQSFWASILPGYRLMEERQVKGAAPADSLEPGLAASATTDSARLRAGASSLEMEQMKEQIAARKARLDSLEKGLLTGGPLGAHPPNTGGVSRADSLARLQEIEAIRRELEFRRARLDSLQTEVELLGPPGGDSTATTRTPRDTTGTSRPNRGSTPRSRR